MTAKDIVSSYNGPGDTKSVIEAQGFGGPPKIVSQYEFDKAAKESGFIAQRTYSASDQETLDKYQEMLYGGDFYVDCTEGGSMYGQGMYCASVNGDQITDGIKAEMQHYQHSYARLGTPKTEDEWMTDAKAELAKNGFTDENSAKWAEAYFEKNHEKSAALMEKISEDDRDRLNDVLSEVGRRHEQPHYTETLTLDPSANVVDYREINDTYNGEVSAKTLTKIVRQNSDEDFKKIGREYGADAETFCRWYANEGVPYEEYDAAVQRLGNDTCKKLAQKTNEIRKTATKKASEYEAKVAAESSKVKSTYKDLGAYAAACGYDAITAEGVGYRCSYTVVLNRTKMIMLDNRGHVDTAEEAGDTWEFRTGKNGIIYAYKNGKKHGWIMPSSVNKKAA